MNLVKKIAAFVFSIVCIFFAAFLFFNCSSKSKKTIEGKSALSDTTHFRGEIMYITKAQANIYGDDLFKHKIAGLQAGDSLLVDESNDLFSPRQNNVPYSVKFSDNGNQRIGFIKGICLGTGINLGNDSTGQKQTIVVHYIKYEPKDSDDMTKGKAEILFIKNHKITHSFKIDAYSNLWLKSIKENKSFPGFRFFLFGYGAEACDYPEDELLAYIKGNILDTICDNDASFSAGNFGTGNQYQFPGDSGSTKGKILVINTTYLYHDSTDDTRQTGYMMKSTWYKQVGIKFIKDGKPIDKEENADK